MAQESVVIVAGGKGTRIKSVLPKQFIEVCGKPVLLHTVEAFIRYSEKISVILVLPQDDIPRWTAIVEKFRFTFPVSIVAGGATRFQSVRNGLSKISGSGLVAIHDGVRPLVSENTIGASFHLAALHKCAVASVPLKESLRVTEHQHTKAVDRSKYRLIQTPQTFDVDLIRAAYEMNEDRALTDDASVAEHAGHTIALFEGSYDNIKITTPEDLVVAEALLRSRKISDL